MKRETLKEILDYSVLHGSWSKQQLTSRAKIVCAYGLGQYFADAFEQWNFREKFNIRYCCDGNIERGKEVANKYNLTFIDKQKLIEYSNAGG